MSDPTTGLDVFTAIATGASALATGAAAVFVARQTKWTRRAAEVAEAGTALSQRMAIEATKTRLDSRAARITIRAAGPVEWPPLEPSAFGEAQPVTIGGEYILPQDGHLLLTLRIVIDIRNHADHPVTLTSETWSRSCSLLTTK